MVDVTPTDETAFREPDATAVRPTPPPRRDDARFTPGLLIADRFRIIAPIGRGGMGEVYRADDTKLGQQVALKFLPDASQEKLQRLYGEVRIGRQVSHPNVCRLYDAFEWEGHHFLSMEYIDGEDLASLLRRIGKLPHDKALEITRELCAGLAAAHALGVIHRDLKPANVMLDGRGRARITDFGLAAFSDDTVAVREMAGTPSYMAPEQLRGGEATHKSDLYALGLIVYELFTGRRMFEAKSVGDLISQHEQSHSRNLSQQTRDVEPNVQRVIVRCLEEKPEQRPPSIHAVIAALPGGDPLQAALDAGETPSPEMIAAAGEVGELRPAVAIGLALAVPLLLLLATLVTQRTRMYEILTLPKSPDVLIDRARDFSAARGNAHPFDRAHFWAVDPDFSRQPRGLDFRGIEPSPVSLVVRESPQSILPKRMLGGSDPPFDVAGMVTLTYDPRGRLLRYFRVLPPVVEHAKPG
ncbi:MAG TPA: serine/threonine-protein kinase, partial [Thermoanaerobaculia bacterium]